MVNREYRLSTWVEKDGLYSYTSKLYFLDRSSCGIDTVEKAHLDFEDHVENYKLQNDFIELSKKYYPAADGSQPSPAVIKTFNLLPLAITKEQWQRI